MRQLGAEAIFVGSGIFKSSDPPARAKAIVTACTYYDRPDVVAEVSEGLGEAMFSIDVRKLDESERMATRGW
jgi:pyridoxal 5'-phosphate synthase pdxS subunit